MIYIASKSNDPFFNMAFEEYIFEKMPRDKEYFMLWQNNNTIVVGKYQNTVEEINQDYVRQHAIKIVRRLSGGGAMYQDMGNLNFTFIVDQHGSKSLDFSIFTKPVVKALKQLGVSAEFTSRNDLTIDGKKFSGNSQYNKQGRTMHHGTLLFHSDLDVIQKALKVSADKIESKGIKSVRSRVTNIYPYLDDKVTLDRFKELLLTYMFEGQSLEEYILSVKDLEEIQKLSDEKYATWDWNYGKSPKYNVKKEKKFETGKLFAYMDIEKGRIKSIQFNGDFFGNGDIAELEKILSGAELRIETIQKILEKTECGSYIKGLTPEMLAEFIVY